MTFQSWVQLPERTTTEPGVGALGLLWHSLCGLTHFPQVQWDIRYTRTGTLCPSPSTPFHTGLCTAELWANHSQHNFQQQCPGQAVLISCHLWSFVVKLVTLIVLKLTLNPASVLTPHFFNTSYKCLWMSSFSEQSFSSTQSLWPVQSLNYKKLDWLCCICSLGQPPSSLTWQMICEKKYL